MAEEIKFNSVEEEIAALRKMINERPEAAKEILKEHTEKNPEEVLGEKNRLPLETVISEAEKISSLPVEEGSKDPYQRQVLQLLQMVEDKGVFNAISVVKKINDPHLEDAFHDALIRFLQGWGEST